MKKDNLINEALSDIYNDCAEQEIFLKNYMKELHKEIIELSKMTFDPSFDEKMTEYEIKQDKFDRFIKAMQRDIRINEILDDDISIE